MKKRLLVLMISVVFGLVGYSQVDVPAAVKQSFSKAYPGVKASWEKEGSLYEAEFKYSGKKMSAVFDESGNMKESETSIKSSELPPTALSYLKERNARITEAAKITMADGVVNYEAEVNGKDFIFDENGKFLRAGND